MNCHTLLVVALVAVALGPMATGCRRAPAEPKVIINAHTFGAEIAATPDRQRVGLMGRPSFPADQAMLFVFRAAGDRMFYMKDCYFPIDVAFLDADRKIINLTTMTVEADPSRPVRRYRSDEPAKYVVETTGGTWDRIGAQSGMTVGFVDVPGQR